MLKVRIIKLKDDKVLNYVEQNAPTEEITKLLSEYSNNFSEDKMQHGTYCEVLLSPTDKDEVTLLWVRRLF